MRNQSLIMFSFFFQATRAFIDTINNIRQKNRSSPVTWSVATKFLAARKWDVARAVALYEAHEATRLREGLVNFDPTQDPLKSELSTGKFTVLVSLLII